MHIAKTTAHIYKDRRFDNWESEIQGGWAIEYLWADLWYQTG